MLAHELCRERIAVYTSEGRSDTSKIVKLFPKVLHPTNDFAIAAIHGLHFTVVHRIKQRRPAPLTSPCRTHMRVSG